MNNKPSTITTKYCLFLSLAIFILSGCDKDKPEEKPAAVLRPVKTIVIQSTGTENRREFPGQVKASQQAVLAFRVSGKLNELPVKEGDEVEQGQVIAKLDDTDFLITLKDAQASYNTALANFNRAKKLLPQGHVSQADYDKLNAEHKTAQSNLELAQKNLNYTSLTAPFTGTIAKKFVENFEEVNAKQEITLLQDTSLLDVSFDLPEKLMILIDRSKKDRDQQRTIYATFNALGGKRFPLTFKEVSTDADKQTQTYQVTFTMEPPQQFNILPGMKTTVIADISFLERQDQTVLLPVNAVVADASKQSTVWLVDEKTMTVHPQVITAGRMQQDKIEISGLNPGDRVVTAGVAFLREGMKVSLLKTGEQPE